MLTPAICGTPLTRRPGGRTRRRRRPAMCRRRPHGGGCGVADMVITEPCLLDDVDEELYHRGRPTREESLSYSGMKHLLPPSTPAHYRYWRDNPPQQRSDAFDLGQAFHTIALGRGDDAVLSPYADWRSGEARAWRDAAKEEGKIPLKPGEYLRVMQMQESVLRSRRAASILCDPAARFEASAFARDPWELGVWLRGRFDVLHPSEGIVDVKTTAGLAAPAVFARKIYDFGYHGQSWLYRTLHELITGDRVPFLFMVVEVDPPHEVSFGEASPAYDDLAEVDVYAAAVRFAACLASGEWPGYGDDVHTYRPPAWARPRADLDELDSQEETTQAAEELLAALEGIMQ